MANVNHQYMFLTWWFKCDKLLSNVIPGYLGFKNHEVQMDKVNLVKRQPSAQIVRESIERTMKNGDEEGRRTILMSLKSSKDSLTGKQLTLNELISNAAILLYPIIRGAF